MCHFFCLVSYYVHYHANEDMDGILAESKTGDYHVLRAQIIRVRPFFSGIGNQKFRAGVPITFVYLYKTKLNEHSTRDC